MTLQHHREMLLFVQSRQGLIQEHDAVKDIIATLNSLKTEIPKSGAEARQFEEPTRDPDAWTPIPPIEHKLVVACLWKYYSLF